MPNIILNDTEIRSVNLYPDTEYQLSDLNFYIPLDYKDYCVYVILNDSVGVNEICKIQCIDQTSNYKIYTFDPLYPLRISSGNTSIYLLLINKDFSNTRITNDLSVLINIDKIKVSHYTLLTEMFSRSLADTYAKNEQLTQLNIEMYNKMLKALKEVE